MADKRISELNEVTLPANEAVLPIVQSGQTQKVTYQNLKQEILGNTTPSTGKFTSVTTPSVTATTNNLTLSAISTGNVNVATAGGTGFQVIESGTVAVSIGARPGNTSASRPSIGVEGTSVGGALSIHNAGGNSIRFYTNGYENTEQARIAHTASAVNYVQVTGSVTGSGGTISSQGSDANIPIFIQSKGTGWVEAKSNGRTAFVMYNPSSSAVNYLQVEGRTSGNAPTILANGSDTNISLGLTSKGNGGVIVTSSTTGVNGVLYIAGGTSGLEGGELRLNGSTGNDNSVIDNYTGQLRFFNSNGAQHRYYAEFRGDSYRFSLGGTANTVSEQFRIAHVANAVNYVQVYGAPTTGAVTIESAGSDANIWFNYGAKGTGRHQFLTNNAVQFQVAHTASADRYVQAQGGQAGVSAPGIGTAGGSEAFDVYSNANSIRFYTNGKGAAPQVFISHTASAVNYINLTGAATSGSPIISAQGSDTNINLGITSKGTTGSVNIWTNNGGAIQFTVAHTASAVNRLQASGSATTQEPVLSAIGSDTDISIAIQPKGTGSIDLASGSTGVNVSKGTTVTAITRTAGGSGYTSNPTIAVSAPNIAGGVQATLSATFNIFGLAIAGGGTGYTAGDVLTVQGGTFTEQLQLTVSTVSAGVITGVTVLTPSFGIYSVIPTNPCSVTGGTGSGATFTFTWTVRSLSVSNAGSGYTSQPTVTFSGGGGSGASAIARVGTGTTFRSLGGTLSFNTYSGEGLRVNNDGFTTLTDYIEIQGGSNVSGAYVGVNGSTATASLYLSAKGGATVDCFTNGQGNARQFRVAHTASAVNYVQVTGGATNNRVGITAQGSDTNVGINVFTKGTGEIVFGGNGREVFVVSPQTSASANFVQLLNGATGVAPIIRPSPFSVDTNVDLSLTTKGTGAVNLNTGNGTAFRASQAFLTGTAVNYIDASGRQTGLGPILSVNGSDTNVRFNITSKGNEAIGLYTNLANQLQFNVTHTASAVNYIQVTGSATGSAPRMSVQGSDSTAGLGISAKGGAQIFFQNNGSSNTSLVLNGGTSTVNYVQINASNTTVAPSLQALGNDTNIDLSLASKGTGGIVGSINSGTFAFTRDTANNAIKLTASNTANLYLQSTGGGAVLVNTSDTVTTQLRVTHTASAVNYVQVTGGATGVFPTMSAQGSDATIGLNLTSKSVGRINFFNNNGSNRHVSIGGNGTAAVNFLELNGNVASSAPSVGVAGSDTNIDLALTPKGTGRVQFGTHTATADTAISGYIEILDAGGTVRRLAVIS